MSMFSFIRKGRQAAKEHKAEKAEKEKKEAQKPPYKHIPKHAAIDAISGGPSGWRADDRQKIVDQNKRRSTMTANGLNMPSMISVHSGLPRVHSALSHVSYPSAYASPHVSMPRTYSYGSMPAGWAPPGGETNYTLPEMPATMSLKGKEVERRMNDPYRGSRSSSKLSVGRYPVPMSAIVGGGDVSVSPVDSSSNSTSSQDDLEMKPTKHTSMPPSTSVTRAHQAPRPASANGSIHRLHPARRLSDADQTTAPAPVRTSFAPRSSSLPRGVPPVPAIPPMQVGTAISTPPSTSNTGSAASSVTMVPVASSTSLASNVPPVVIPMSGKVDETDDTHEIYFTPEPSSDEEASPVGTAITFPTATASPTQSPTTKNGRRTSKYTRFTELTTINSNVSVSVETVAPPRATLKPTPSDTIKEIEDDARRPTSTIAHSLPINFDEGSLPAPKELDLPVPASKKLSKSQGGGKLSKKPRWSLRSNKNSAVAV